MIPKTHSLHAQGKRGKERNILKHLHMAISGGDVESRKAVEEGLAEEQGGILPHGGAHWLQVACSDGSEEVAVTGRSSAAQRMTHLAVPHPPLFLSSSGAEEEEAERGERGPGGEVKS